MAPKSWGKASSSAKELVYSLVYKEFPFLQAENNWKVDLLCSIDYPGWVRNNLDDQGNWLAGRKVKQEDEGPTIDEPATSTGRKRKARSSKFNNAEKKLKVSETDSTPELAPTSSNMSTTDISDDSETIYAPVPELVEEPISTVPPSSTTVKSSATLPSPSPPVAPLSPHLSAAPLPFVEEPIPIVSPFPTTAEFSATLPSPLPPVAPLSPHFSAPSPRIEEPTPIVSPSPATAEFLATPPSPSPPVAPLAQATSSTSSSSPLTSSASSVTPTPLSDATAADGEALGNMVAPINMSNDTSMPINEHSPIIVNPLVNLAKKSVTLKLPPLPPMAKPTEKDNDTVDECKGDGAEASGSSSRSKRKTTSNRKMRPTKNKTAYNLCALRWLAQVNENGMREEFRAYWDQELTEEQREAYKKEVKDLMDTNTWSGAVSQGKLH